jgi:hypothetical protein
VWNKPQILFCHCQDAGRGTLEWTSKLDGKGVDERIDEDTKGIEEREKHE